jgi:two-component system OmpR family sensor kinase
MATSEQPGPARHTGMLRRVWRRNHGAQKRSLLRPSRWPVRWRIAATSSALTFLILIAFALIVGRLLTTRIQDSFNDELRGASNQVAAAIRVRPTVTGEPKIMAPNLEQVALANTAWVRVAGINGTTYGGTAGAPRVSAPPRVGVTTDGSLAVATAAVPTLSALPPMFVQYARDRTHEADTVERAWLLLGGGVLAGTVLAGIAGMRVARRAMGPIADLTTAAKQIARTGDPAQRIVDPQTSDEVAELAQTLDGMLQALDRARQDRESMITWQREFVADASHELRTPLTSALANLELLQEMLSNQRGGEAAEQREIVDSALRSSRRMRKLVNDLVLLARSDAKRASVRKPCDLVEITRGAVEELAPIAGDHHIAFAGTEPLVVDGNPDELHRMVINLVDNAIYHTPTDTDIDITVTRSNTRAVIRVNDNGPGIQQDMRERVFDRFVHGEGLADRSAGGVGLGLAIVRAVAESHGGDVELVDHGGGGACFVVELPLVADGPVEVTA